MAACLCDDNFAIEADEPQWLDDDSPDDPRSWGGNRADFRAWRIEQGGPRVEFVPDRGYALVAAPASLAEPAADMPGVGFERGLPIRRAEVIQGAAVPEVGGAYHGSGDDYSGERHTGTGPQSVVELLHDEYEFHTEREDRRSPAWFSIAKRVRDLDAPPRFFIAAYYEYTNSRFRPEDLLTTEAVGHWHSWKATRDEVGIRIRSSLRSLAIDVGRLRSWCPELSEDDAIRSALTSVESLDPIVLWTFSRAYGLEAPQHVSVLAALEYASSPDVAAEALGCPIDPVLTQVAASRYGVRVPSWGADETVPIPQDVARATILGCHRGVGRPASRIRPTESAAPASPSLPSDRRPSVPGSACTVVATESAEWVDELFDDVEETAAVQSPKIKGRRTSLDRAALVGTMPVHSWLMAIAPSEAAAVLLSWIRYWSEPSQPGRGPRTKYIAGGYFWFVERDQATLAWMLGLTPAQINHAIRDLRKADLIVIGNEKDVADLPTWALPGHHEPPPPGYTVRLRINPDGVYRRLHEHCVQHGRLEQWDHFAERVTAHSARHEHPEAEEGGFYRSAVQSALMEERNKAFARIVPGGAWTNVCFRALQAIRADQGSILHGIVLSRLMDFSRTREGNYQPTTRPLKYGWLAEQIGVFSATREGKPAERQSRLERAIGFLARSGWISRAKIYDPRTRTSYITVTPTKRALELFAAAAPPEKRHGTAREEREQETYFHTASGQPLASWSHGTPRPSRRRKVEQHNGPPDGRLKDPRTDRWYHAITVAGTGPEVRDLAHESLCHRADHPEADPLFRLGPA